MAHTKYLSERLQDIADGKQKHLIVEMPPRSGKLISDDTPIYTPTGWRTHGDLKVGDYVYHPSGVPIMVLGKNGKDKADWEVTFTSGEKISCHGNHEWEIYDRATSKKRVVETRWFRRKTKFNEVNPILTKEGRCKYQLPNISALENEEKELPIDPYVLGVWLGDGTASKPCITYDKKDYAMIREMESRGYPISVTHLHKNTGVPTTYFSGTRHKPGRLTKELRDNNLKNNKHIPDVFLKSSIKQRLDLLAGLVDSDGHCDVNSRIRYSTTNEKIRDGVYELCNSLGFRPYITEHEPKLSTSNIQGRKKVYQIGFNPIISIPNKIKRKRPKRLIKQRRVGIIDVKYNPVGKIGNCIQVDSRDGLYLVGKKLMPTHNSITITETFPSYYIGRNPDKKVIVTAYSDGLARKFGRLNRNKLVEFGGNIFGVSLANDNGTVNNWGIDDSVGGMIATGIGGSITGEGADCCAGFTVVKTNKGNMTIKDIHNSNQSIYIDCFNHVTEVKERKRLITSREIKTEKQMLKITLGDGSSLTTTDDHKYYVLDKHYIFAKDIGTKDKIACYDEIGITFKSVKSIEEVMLDDNLVYDIQVEDNHNFFANGMLVHNCMIIDDPIKNNEEAQSQTMRDKVWDEWETTLSTRLHKGASVIVVMTRWHEDDFVGRLLERSPYNWERIRMPAIAEDDDDLLGREVGTSLAPELGYDEDWAELKKKEVGSKTWASLYQQRPSASEGNIFNRNWWQYYESLPRFFDEQVISWDLTFKDNKDNDYVVGQVWGRKGADYYLIDQVRDKMDFPTTVTAVRNLANKHPRAMAKLIEDKANGPAVIATLKREVNGIIPVNPQGSKVARAQAVTPVIESGNVFLPKHKEFSYDLIEEAAAFPNGKHDDQVDSASQALSRLANKRQAGISSVNIW